MHQCGLCLVPDHLVLGASILQQVRRTETCASLAGVGGGVYGRNKGHKILPAKGEGGGGGSVSLVFIELLRWCTEVSIAVML